MGRKGLNLSSLFKAGNLTIFIGSERFKSNTKVSRRERVKFIINIIQVWKGLNIIPIFSTGRKGLNLSSLFKAGILKSFNWEQKG